MKLELDKMESRIEWMSRPVFIGLLMKPKIFIHDKWESHQNSNGKVDEACCMINVDGSWSDLQMIITKNTTRDISKIIHKFISFFNDQIQSSKMMWSHYEFDRASTDSDISTSTRHSASHDANSIDISPGTRGFFNKRYRTISTQTQPPMTEHWQNILDLVTDVQMHKKFLPLPTVKSGITFVGGVVDFRAGRISLACMNGDMSATTQVFSGGSFSNSIFRWALFHIRQANTLLMCKSKYSFIDPESQSVGVHTEHKFVFKVSGEGAFKNRLPYHKNKSRFDVVERWGSRFNLFKRFFYQRSSS